MTREEAIKLTELINRRSETEIELTRLLMTPAWRDALREKRADERDKVVRAVDAARVELEMYIVTLVRE